MSQYQIAALIGSLRKDSLNRKLAQALEKKLPSDFSFTYPALQDLPLYNQDDDSDPAENVRLFKREIVAAQGILFFTPEYNRSIPGALKNALDQASRPWGQNVWIGKPAAIIGVSVGSLGTCMAQNHLRSILSLFDMPVMNQPEAYIHATDAIFTPDGDLGDTMRPFLEKWLDHALSWIKKHATPQKQAA